MGQSGHILRENGEPDLDRLLAVVRQAADAIGYPCYVDEGPHSRRSNGDDYMTMCIWEYRDKTARSFLVYLFSGINNQYYDCSRIKIEASSIVVFDRFYDREDMLLRFLQAYLKICPNDLFYAEQGWLYTKADIDRIASMPYHRSWCYRSPLESPAPDFPESKAEQKEAPTAPWTNVIERHIEYWAQHESRRDRKLLISKFDTSDIEQKMDLFEKQYHISLPGQYRDFLRKYNGGFTPGAYFLCEGVELCDVPEFRGLGDVPIPFWDQNVQKYIKWDLLPIAYDGLGMDILIGIGDENYGKIFNYNSNMWALYEWEDLRTFLACCYSEVTEPSRLRSFALNSEFFVHCYSDETTRVSQLEEVFCLEWEEVGL